jgi:uncharacterized protein YraI
VFPESQAAAIGRHAVSLSRRRFAAFLPVALAAGLALTGGIASPGPDAHAAPSAVVAAQATNLQTTADLNLRAGPGTTYRVLRVLPKGVRVFDHGQVRNGFRKVTYNNTVGWASGQYLAPGTQVPPHAGPVIGTAVTTTSLNLRAGPSTGEGVIRVMRQGSAVEITGTLVDGFRYVYHQGTGGWAFDRYLGTGVPGDGPYDPRYATATANLNLRARPSTSSQVLLVIPSGAKVRLGAEFANGFRAVTYNGVTGWASTAYLN